jgi:hypothetical protein
VEDQSPANPIPQRLGTHYSHKTSALHRLFLTACGRGGKPGSSRATPSTVFQNSSNPQPGFRKSNRCPSSTLTITSEEYPLFRPELRLLLSFLYILYPFPHSPSHQVSNCKNRFLQSRREVAEKLALGYFAVFLRIRCWRTGEDVWQTHKR